MASAKELKKQFKNGAVPTEKDFHDLIDLANEPGPQGEPGFVTEEQYNDLLSRVKALEGPAEETPAE